MGGRDLKGYSPGFGVRKCRDSSEIYCGCSGQSWEEDPKRKCTCGTNLSIYNKTDKCCLCKKNGSE